MPQSSWNPELPQDANQRVSDASENAEARLQLAIALIQEGSLEEATRHAREAARRAPADWPKLAALGVVLFQLGEFFPLAYATLEQAARKGPMSARALRMLAALHHRKGEAEKERQCMAAAARRKAVEGPRQPHPDRPRVLRLRSAEKSFFGIKTKRKTGLRYTTLKGGHFSIANLADPERINLYIATVFEDNLEGVEGLPDFDLFINGVSCPDLDPDGLDRIEAFLNKYPDVPVINPPGKVRLTTRAENARRLDILPGVHMPRTELFVLDGPADELALRIETAVSGYPLIVRHCGTQTGKSMEKIDSRQALLAWLSEQSPGTPIHAIDYIDCRGQDGYYHKARAFFIDGTFFPVANLSSDTWQIHSGDRYRVMASTPSTQEDEKRYLADPEAYLGAEAYRALHAIRDSIDLDFFGIDFTLDPDGRVLVFEANAAMRHNFDHADNFPYTRPYLERISQAFADMLDRRAKSKRDGTEAPRSAVIAGDAESDVPRLSLAPFLGAQGRLSAGSRRWLLEELVARLTAPPYWLVFVTGQVPIDLEMLTQTLQAMADAGRPQDSEPQRISRTKVQVNPEAAARKGGVTRYSRTPGALPLHTDCSNHREPPNLVAFAMERPDAAGGGESTILSASDLVDALPDGLVELLRQPRFPFARGRRFPIVDGEGDTLRMRYYRNQIESGSKAEGLPDELTRALDELDRHLETSQHIVRFHLQAGDALMLDNQRVMHGRSAMPPTSNRLMHRFRLSSPLLV